MIVGYHKKRLPELLSLVGALLAEGHSLRKKTLKATVVTYPK